MSCGPARSPRYRIAPSPTGFFHVGGARTALWNWALARSTGGRFVLRVEDTDEARNRPEWTKGIIDALAWLGIEESDPTFEGPYLQSADAERHVAAAHELAQAGAAYYCDLTADEIRQRAAESGRPGYDGYSRDRGLDPAPGRVLRFRVPEGATVVHDAVRGEVVFDNATIEDFVLLRGNGRPMFLLANVVDDIEMDITHVVRGDEHLANTPKQQMLWQALGHEPPVWAHVPLLVNEQRKKLSKRRDKVALEQYRAEGYLAGAMVNYLMTLGWAPSGGTEILPWAEIEAEFRVEDVVHSPAFFDVKKLDAFNGEYIRALAPPAFLEAVDPFLPESVDRSVFEQVAPLVQTRIVRLDEAAEMVAFLFTDDVALDEASWAKATKAPWSGEVLAETVDVYAALEEWNADTLKAALESIGVARGLKLGKTQAPIRVAVTGRSVGPPLFESLEVLGRDRTLQRLGRALSRVGAPT